MLKDCRFIKWCALTLISIVALTTPVYAQQNEWKEKKQDFTKINTILIFDPVAAPTVQDELAVRKVVDIMDDKFKPYHKKVKFITLQEVHNSIHTDTGINLDDLFAKDKDQYIRLVLSSVPKYCDSVLSIEILTMGYSTRYMEGYSFPITSNQTTYYNANINGRQNVSGYASTPTTQYYNVPGGNVEVVNVGLRFTMYNAAAGNMIWSFSDIRDRANERRTDNTKTEDILNRIINSTNEKFKTLMEKRKED